jgi:hypothetical protein
MPPPKEPNVSLSEREAALLARPGLLDEICSHIASGGTLDDLAQTWAVRYGALANWIRETQERSSRYDRAIFDRRNWGEETVLAELRAIAKFDIRELLNNDGTLKPVNKWPAGVSKAVMGLELAELLEAGEKTGVSKKMKLADKIKALELMGRHFGMFKTQVEHSGSLKLEELVTNSLKDSDKW